MSRINKKSVSVPVFTHEGARTNQASLKDQLRRSVMSCLLWEDSFYESGQDIAQRISELVYKNKPEVVANIAVEARENMKLRHVPLLLVREMARNPSHRHLVGETLSRVIQRPDELSEFLALYWKDGKDQPLASQVKKGLANAFTKFDRYALSKYNRDADIKLRDVLFLCHAKPENESQAVLWKDLVEDKLEAPDTWEVALSAGADKKETFERLISENKLGALALLRNLRGMTEAGVSKNIISKALLNVKTERVLPFRFISAARHAMQFEPELETAMFKCLEGAEKLAGETVLLIDVSGSMNQNISGKSELSRMDAACGLAILLREICESVRVYTFSTDVVEVAPRRGFALRDAVKNSQAHRDTYLDKALKKLDYGAGANRIIVITDEQSHDKVSAPKTKGYMLNVASYQNGVGYGSWNHIDGWSDSVVNYVSELERKE